jgi:hypothetical protein
MYTASSIPRRNGISRSRKPCDDRVFGERGSACELSNLRLNPGQCVPLAIECVRPLRVPRENAARAGRRDIDDRPGAAIARRTASRDAFRRLAAERARVHATRSPSAERRTSCARPGAERFRLDGDKFEYLCGI